MGKRKMITFRGETKWLTEWAQIMGLNRSTVYHRLAKGYSVEEALTMPERDNKAGRRYVDHAGERYGLLTVRQYMGTGSDGCAKWLCDCDCGRQRTVSSKALAYVKSCGCQSTQTERRKHPVRKSAEQPCWSCKKYAGGCSWSRKNPEPVKGWKAVPTVKCQGNWFPIHSYEILYCPEYISDGTEHRGET